MKKEDFYELIAQIDMDAKEFAKDLKLADF